MYGYIYKIENKCNGKVYIGQTTRNPKTRKREHINKLLKSEHSNYKLLSDFHKFGAHNFKFTIIGATTNQKSLDELEIKYIELFDSLTNEKGYNIRFGGNNGKHSVETCLKLSESRKGELNPFHGSTHSLNTRKLISNNNSLNNFGFIGIKLMKNVNPENKPWYARIQYKGYEKSLGTFNDPLSGELVYKFVVGAIQ